MAVQYGSAGQLQARLQGPYGSVSIRVTELMLPAQGWKGAISPYSQEVTVPGITVGGKVDLQLSPEQLARPLGIGFLAENDGGVVTVYALGGRPEEDLYFQATVMEVNS